MDNYGILSLAPALIAVILAFITREALFSILCGVLVGLLITGQDLLFGFTGIIQSALGNADFIWVIGIEVFIGIMVAFFQKSGAISAVANKLNEKLHITPKIAQVMGAALGVLIFFSDYFSRKAIAYLCSGGQGIGGSESHCLVRFIKSLVGCQFHA